MGQVRLDYWSCTRGNADPYRVPEQEAGVVRLHGIVTCHPYKEDGHEVTTTRVVEVKGRVITTRSGTVYRLGKIHPTYRRWLKMAGIPYDPQCPIVVRGEDEPLKWKAASRLPGGADYKEGVN